MHLGKKFLAAIFSVIVYCIITMIIQSLPKTELVQVSLSLSVNSFSIPPQRYLLFPFLSQSTDKESETWISPAKNINAILRWNGRYS